jgi:serine/threonine protein kinase
LTSQQSLSILIDVADGMQYLHARVPPIIHRDLKSHNIFITETIPGKYIAKIGDWGSARAVQMTGSRSMTQGVGTACWLSPEVINNAHFSKASDVYAFGIILWEVYTRQEIYDGLSTVQIIAKVANEGLRPHIPRDCPWAKVMTQCWKHDPSQRPSFEVILSAMGRLQHKYLLLQQHQKRDRSGDSAHTNQPMQLLDIQSAQITTESVGL